MVDVAGTEGGHMSPLIVYAMTTIVYRLYMIQRQALGSGDRWQH